MRVRCLGYAKEDGNSRRENSLTVGGGYVVLAINVEQSDRHDFMLLDDRTQRPGWYPSSDFDLVSDEVPSNWRIAVGGLGSANSLTVAPALWLEPGFLEDYWDDGGVATVAAHGVFDRELQLILRES
jgi:hypothetical protein